MNHPSHVSRGQVHSERGLSGFRTIRCVVTALVLTVILSPFSVESRGAALRTGVTILVHGFTPADGVRNPPYEYWGGTDGENLKLLLERFGSGLVWEYDPASGLYSNITHSMNDAGAFRIPRGDWFPAFAGEQILLFDWTEASDEKEAGQAEAAADALFASLMRFTVDGERIITSSPYTAARPLHFIGHSRGTVVVSETVQRLGRFNIPVSYVTYLDIHDFGQDGILNDEFFHDPAVQVWDNINYVDVFYQNHPALPCVNPAGRPLDHITDTNLQVDVTGYTTPSIARPCTPNGRPHSWVKDFYWLTAKSTGVQNLGFNKWLAGGGYDHPRDTSTKRVRCTVSSEVVGFVWKRDLVNDRSYWDRDDVPPVLFNGDFDLPDLDRGIGGIGEGNSLAGWTYFGGGGSSFVEPNFPDPPAGAELPNSYLSLHGLRLVARHNRFYLPTTARELRFAISVPFVPVTPLIDHILEVRLGNRVLRRYTVAQTDGFQVRTANILNHPDLLGGVNTLTFELLTGAGAGGLTARARIDNVSIVTDSIGWVESIAPAADGKVSVHWQCWPAATFFLEGTSNLGASTWTAITNNATPATAGTFTMPTDDEPRFVRGRIVPAR